MMILNDLIKDILNSFQYSMTFDDIVKDIPGAFKEMLLLANHVVTRSYGFTKRNKYMSILLFMYASS